MTLLEQRAMVVSCFERMEARLKIESSHAAGELQIDRAVTGRNNATRMQIKYVTSGSCPGEPIDTIVQSRTAALVVERWMFLVQ